MFRHRIPIGRILGISIDLDYSWFLIVGLLTWLLAVSYYPAEFRNWSPGEDWLMGLATSLMLFVSVLIHELGHSVIAKRYGLAVPRITLFIFGGVSQIATEPPSATAEFWIAIVGPLVSIGLAAFFWESQLFLGASQPLYALAEYLAVINLILAVFNLIPGFPLDGGRVLRSILWRFGGNYQRATSIAAFAGRLFGFLLIAVGVWQALSGSFLNGLWIAFIGWFLESAAGSQLQAETLKNLLGEHRVLDAMQQDFVQVSGDVTLQELVDKYILPSGARYMVVTNGTSGSPGMLTPASIHAVPRYAWATTTASQVMVPLQKLATTTADAKLWGVIGQMGREGVNQLPVLNVDRRVVGVVSREDILHYLGALQSVAK